MKRRITAFAAVALVACFPLATPLRACCDSFWSCVGAVASGGLTCVVEGLINTVKTLIDNVGRLVSTLGQQVSDVVNLARTELGNAANDIRGLASQAESEFAAAAQLANKVVTDAARPPLAIKGAIPHSAMMAPAAPASAAVSAPAGALAKPPAGGAAKAPAGGAAKAPALTGSPVGGVTPGAAGAASHGNQIIANLPADPAEIMEAMRRAKDAIDALRPEVANPINKVRQFAGQAEQQVASAVGAAAGIAENALLSPLRALGNMLGNLVAHPEKIFDPSSIVDDAINQVTTQVITTMNQVHDAVMSQARATLNQAHQPLQDALGRAATAKKIADAMQKLEGARTKGACDGLNAVVPRQHVDVRALVSHVAVATHASGIAAIDLNQHKTLTAAPYARLDAAKLTARTAGTQMNAKLKGPWQEFKRLKAAPVKLDPSAKVKMDEEIARRFAGKTAAESAAEKRAMLAEARAHFGNDPDLLRKVGIVIEGHPIINGRLGGPRPAQ